MSTACASEGDARPVISVSPVVLASPNRGVDLRVRVSAPTTGRSLPIVIFSHGFGSSAEGYAPLASFWAAHGFVVVQPTFLDSRTLALAADDPRTPVVWKHRVADVVRVLDRLDDVLRAIPGLAERADRDRIAAAGHSFGAHTTGMLLGARTLGPDRRPAESMADPRIRAGILLCAGGRGGADLSPYAAEHFPYLDQTYTDLVTPTLVVAGDRDHSPLTVRGADWFTDVYELAPGAGWLLTLLGGEHMLGGISGDRVTETTDESPARVALVQRLTLAYMRTALDPGDDAWPAARAALAATPHRAATIVGKHAR